MPRLLSTLALAQVATAYTITVAEQFMEKNIDPIVFPGQYSKSHMHSFYGSDAVTINTTTSAELQTGCSTAENPNDYSIYWVPTLFAVSGSTHTPVPPMRFSAYYVSIENAEIAIPQDFSAVAGSASAKTQSAVDPLAGISWFCEGDAADANKDAAAFPTKTCSTHLQTLLLFHDCVDPETLGSAYSGTQNWSGSFKPANRCPAGMKRMPQLRYSIRYDLRKILPSGWSGKAPLALACGAPYCSHGDFINGWLPAAAEDMLKSNDKREFRAVAGPNGDGNGGSVCKSAAKDRDPSRGTSDYAESVAAMGVERRSVHRRLHGRRG